MITYMSSGWPDPFASSQSGKTRYRSAAFAPQVGCRSPIIIACALKVILFASSRRFGEGARGGGEREVLDKQLEGEEAEPAVPHRKIVGTSDNLTIEPDHPDPSWGYALLEEAIGAGSKEFSSASSCNSAGVLTHFNTMQLNFMFSVVRSIRPRDQMEAMLAIQMAAVHRLMMSFFESSVRSVRLEQQEIVDRIVNGVTRTYALQMGTLKRFKYR